MQARARGRTVPLTATQTQDATAMRNSEKSVLRSRRRLTAAAIRQFVDVASHFI